MEYVRREKHYHVFKESVLMGEISENKEKWLARSQFRTRALGRYICGHTAISALMMGTEMVPETSVIFNQLTRLTAWEDFINVSRREGFRSHKRKVMFVPGEQASVIGPKQQGIFSSLTTELSMLRWRRMEHELTSSIFIVWKSIISYREVTEVLSQSSEVFTVCPVML
jgi:hypothetical protein